MIDWGLYLLDLLSFPKVFARFVQKEGLLDMLLFDATATAAEEESSITKLMLESLQNWSSKGWPAFFSTLFTGILWVLIMRLLVMWFVRVLKKIFARSKNINNLMAAFVCKAVTIISWILIAVWFLGHMGINIAPVLAGLGVTGVILGLAFQETIGNLLSGMMIVINAPFKIGDYIDSGSYSGTVTDMDMSCVTLLTPDNKKITMSNKLVWSNPIVNYSSMDKRRVDMTVTVAYGSDIGKVKTLLLSMLASYPEVLPNPQPIVEVDNLEDSAIDFLVRPWTKPGDYWAVKWRFQGEWYGKLTAAGINVPYDQLDVHLFKKGE